MLHILSILLSLAMDWSPPFPSSPPQVRWSGPRIPFDPIPEYPSSMRADSYASPEYPPVTGLGISHCEMDEKLLDPLRVYPPPTTTTTTTTTRALSSAAWPDRLMQPHYLQQDSAVDVGPYPSTTPYESPLSLYSAQTLSASPSYSSAMDMGENRALSGPPLGYWSTTPCSDITTPPENFVQVKEEPEEYWDPSLFADERRSIDASTMMMPRQVVVNDAFTDPQLLCEQSEPSVAKQEPETSTVSKPPTETSSDTDRTDRENPKSPTKSPPGRKPKTSTRGTQCPICKSWFTRRSNCNEHMKKHYPNLKRNYKCDRCDNTFGRKTDQRRHVESVSHCP